MPPAIHLIAGLPAALVVARYRDGDVLVLVNAEEPWRQILNLARLLPHDERRELARVLLTH